MDMQARQYFVYILSSRSRTLYTGVTGDLVTRVYQHKQGTADGFTRQYNVHRLVYFEEFGTAGEAIAREKQIKGWLRAKKIGLIESMNPAWDDLSAMWYAEDRGAQQREV